jgi:hypothetical protein
VPPALRTHPNPSIVAEFTEPQVSKHMRGQLIWKSRMPLRTTIFCTHVEAVLDKEEGSGLLSPRVVSTSSPLKTVKVCSMFDVLPLRSRNI